MNAPVHQQQAKLFTIRKTRPTALELGVLADQFADETARLEDAGDNEDFAAMRAAAVQIADIVDKINFLTIGLCHAFNIEQGVKS